MIVLVLLGAILIMVLLIYASKMQEIAEMKGYSGRVFAWCFFLPILGALMVIALPDRKKDYVVSSNREKSFDTIATQDDELPEL